MCLAVLFPSRYTAWQQRLVIKVKPGWGFRLSQAIDLHIIKLNGRSPIPGHKFYNSYMKLSFCVLWPNNTNIHRYGPPVNGISAWPFQYPPETHKGLFLYLLNMADFKMYKILRDELLWWITNVVSITAWRTFETFDKHRQSVHGVVSIHVLILSLDVLCLYDALFVSLADYGQERIILSCYGTN